MALTAAQSTIVAKARSVGGGAIGVALSEEVCSYLVAVIIRDLGLEGEFSDPLPDVLPFFSTHPLSGLVLPDTPFLPLFEKLVSLVPDAASYFGCLATLHKARLKYEAILRTQPIPTIDQVGPRSLLQYGTLTPKGLADFLLWRKWIYDIDNRAAQETGYVFEPIIAASIGGTPVSASKSPIKRSSDPRKGRQVDCIRPDLKAYEVKLRVTIAASGQGRWSEELDFPGDCKASGHIPVLVVLDPTPNTKLSELSRAFQENGGEVYVGDDAWQHFNSLAGVVMSRFLETYVHEPINSLLQAMPANGDELPELVLKMTAQELYVAVDGETLVTERSLTQAAEDANDALPEDVDEVLSGL
ncbi:MAG TPA: hypothetical protein VFA07_11575 [Chthonomonadaceae bacterium]|nr:hypothetical protein [Chthonomonadaceae bacterium]